MVELNYVKPHKPLPRLIQRTIRSATSLSREKSEPFIYVVIVGVFETISDFWNPLFGDLLHGILMLWLVYRGSTHTHRDVGNLLLCMSVCPMIRLVSFAVSPIAFRGIWYYITTEGVILVAGFCTVWVCGFSFKSVGIQLDKLLFTTPLVLLSGFVIGWMEAHIVSASPLVVAISLDKSWFVSLMLIIFTGFTEEFTFRGIIQNAAAALYKPWITILYTSLTWSLLHLGWYSWREWVFVSTIGLLWGTLRYVNQGIITLSITHGLANLMLFVVIPYLNNRIP